MYRIIILTFLACTITLQAQTFKVAQQLCTDGNSRPYVVYTPKSEGAKPKPLLVFLHGAVATPQVNANPEGYARKSPLVAIAESTDCFMLFPFGQKGAAWFDHVGQQMVLDEITAVQHQYPIDPNRIFLSGFSDGGSGVYYFAMTHPDLFAGFIAMNGSLKVASMLGEEELFPSNMNQKPLYILNTTGDSLYPLEQITPSIDFLQKENPNITFKTPIGDHFLSYLPQEQAGIVTFINSHSRQPLTHIVWETSDISRINRIGWLQLQTLALDQERAPWHTLYPEVKIQNNKADLGVKYDYTYKGKGMRIAGFKNDTVTAKRLGAKEGDILIALERDSIRSPMAPMLYTTKKKAGDPTELTVLREGTAVVLKGNFNQGYPYALLKHQHKTAKIEAEIRGKEVYVRTSRIGTYEIDRRQTPVKIKRKVKNLTDKP